MLNCSEEMRQRWVAQLRNLGVDEAVIGNVEGDRPQ